MLISTPENDPFFWQYLYQNPNPTNQKSPFYVVREGSFLLENVSESELEEYCLSGEYEEVENSWSEVTDYYTVQS